MFEKDGKKFILTIGGQKILDDDNQPFSSKSENGAKGKIKEIIDNLNRGHAINLEPINDGLNKNECGIINFPIPGLTEPE